MKNSINLASQPFENVRSLYTAVVVGAVIMLALALTLSWEIRTNRDQSRELTQQAQRLQKDSEALQREQRELTQWLERPEVQEIRDRSSFLNSLIAQKSLSWTQMFMDLEKVLPERVQVTTIRPSRNESSDAKLSLTVASADVAPVIEFLKKLETSPQFSAPALDSQRFPNDSATDRNILFDLSVNYRQTAPEAAPSASGKMDAGAARQNEAAHDANSSDSQPAALAKSAASGTPKGGR
jgi:type IV pilus assembly protein PilN